MNVSMMKAKQAQRASMSPYWRVFLLVSAGLVFLGSWAQAGRFDKVKIKATHVSGGVYMLTGAGGNIAVCKGVDGLLMVDDQFAPLAPKIEAVLKGMKSGPVKWVLNTHYHGDHTGGNLHFGKGAVIVAHNNVRKRLSVDHFDKMFKRKRKSIAKGGWPVVTFQQSLSIHFNAERIDIVHLPHGHTDGDSAVFFRKAKVVHLGDHFFVDRLPFIDLSSGGSVEGYQKNVTRLLTLIPDGYKIIPGHGKLATKADLQRFKQMLDISIARVRAGIKAKQTLAQLQNAGMPKKYHKWAQGFITAKVWIKVVYTSLTKK